jgi:hypothetical protein
MAAPDTDVPAERGGPVSLPGQARYRLLALPAADLCVARPPGNAAATPGPVEAWQQRSQGLPAERRTFAWLHQFKRLRIRYETRADLHLGLLQLACSIICLRRLRTSF